MDSNNLIDELGEIIYISDPHTYELLYTNEHGKRILGLSDYRGVKCYEAIQGRKSPCPFCTSPLLHDDEFYIWEHSNPHLGRHFMLKDKLIDWNGKLARMEIAVDITERESVSRRVQQKLRTEHTLVECIRALTAAGSLEESMQAVLAGIGEFYQADRAYLLELDPQRIHATNAFEWCAPGVTHQQSFLSNTPLGDLPFWSKAFQSQTVVSIPDAEDLRDRYPAEYARLKIQDVRSLMAAPFMLGDENLGYVGVDNPAYNADDPSLLQSITYFIISELQKRRMQIELEYQSRHDPLTGLYNRFQYLQDTWDSGEFQSAAVVFCDINGLKQINDTLGHSAGDKAIIRTAEILRSCFPQARLYRLSGDEFVVLCLDMDQEVFLEKFHAAQRVFQAESSRGVSLGYAWSEHIRDMELLCHQADEAMYQAKAEYYASQSSGAQKGGEGPSPSP